jgi:hypothetical protein
MDELKVGGVILCLARPFCTAKLTQRLQIFRAKLYGRLLKAA